MKQFIGEWLLSSQAKLRRGVPFHWGGGEVVLAVILIIGILSLGSGMVGKWINAAGDNGILPVSLHSLSEADYSVDEIMHSVPAIGLDIIRDLLGVDKPPETGGLPDIAVIIPKTPTATSTVFGSFPSVITPTSDVPIVPTATKIPGSTATSYPQPSATSFGFSTQQPTATQNLTNTPVEPTNTRFPTATSGIINTNTPEPTKPPPTPVPTIAPTFTPVPMPTNTPPVPTQPPPPTSSPIPQPTRSSTLAVTPTAQYTPGITGEPPEVP